MVKRRNAHNDDDDAFDERGILRDRHTFRVPLRMADAIDIPDQPGPVRIRDGATLNARDRAAFEHREAAYRAYDEAAAIAWQSPPLRTPPDQINTDAGNLPYAARPYYAAVVGDVCTVHGGQNDGATGTIQTDEQGNLVCVPNDGRSTDARQTDGWPPSILNDTRFVENDRSETTRAYQEYDQRMFDAWRTNK